MLRVPLDKPEPDIERFVRVIRGEEIPRRPPLVELFLDREIEREISRSYLGREWDDAGNDREAQEAAIRNRIEVYHRMGYDFIRVSGGISFPGRNRIAADTASLSRGSRSWAEEEVGPISSWSDYESYPWPDLGKVELWGYEYAARNLPEGMGLFVCPSSGFLEIPLHALFGYENLGYLLHDDPGLVAAVFQKVGELIYGFYTKLIGLPNLYGFFQGDDMGFKTQTLIAPADLRRYVLQWHKRLAALAHEHGLLYLLHACGNIEQIMPDLIDEVRIDARHSFEAEGNPVQVFKRKYGARVAVLGGVDVDKLARLPEDELRRHVRRIIEACLPGGRFALGSGNSVCNYVPVSNYFAMVEEGLNFDGGR
jgi:uroporphyrinogen decarboxylase